MKESSRYRCEIVVWGTGRIYHRFKNGLYSFNIKYLVDNKTSLQGTEIDGIEVISGDRLKNITFSWVVIFVDNPQFVQEIRKQLLETDIPEDKICTYKEVLDITGCDLKVHGKRGTVTLDKWFLNHRHNKKILVMTPDFSYTGVPIAAMNLSQALRSMGYSVVLGAQYDDGRGLIQEVQEQEIDYMRELSLCSHYFNWFADRIAQFDCVIVVSLVQSELVERYGNSGVKLLWWIHETAADCYRRELPHLNNNVFVYGGGNRVIEIFNKYYKGVTIRKLQYSIPDTKSEDCPSFAEPITFGVIGTVCQRKAQDLVLHAISEMPPEYRNTFECLITGKMIISEPEYCEENRELIQKLPEVWLIGEMRPGQLDQMYGEIDVLICPSRDDPMPIVVTQAMMHEKFCIISENVGQAEFICQGENGFVFANEDVEELRKDMIWVLEHKTDICNAGKRSREIYEREFSPDVMKKNLLEIMDEMKV